MPPWSRHLWNRVQAAAAVVRKRLWPLQIGPHIAMMLAAATSLTILLGWMFGIDLPSASDQAAKPFEGVKLVLAVVAGIGGIVALTVAYRKQKLGEAAEGRLDAAESREQSRLFHERFAAATEQLGSGSADIRTAGAYALAHLADDWDDGRQTCINVLCAHIRKPYAPPEELPDDAIPDVVDRNEARQQQRQVRHTILDIIGERLRAEPEPGKTWHGHDFDFTGATIDGGNLSKARCIGGTINFRDAQFADGSVDFRRAEVTGGTINFIGATFTSGNVHFIHVKFTDGKIHFGRGEFNGGTVDFYGTTFAGSTIDFYGTKFAGGNVDFVNTEFSGGYIHFANSKFIGSNLRFVGAKFTGSAVDFFGAKFTGATVDLRYSDCVARPPQFDEFPDGPPTGLLLPAHYDAPPE